MNNNKKKLYKFSFLKKFFINKKLKLFDLQQNR